VTSGFPHPNQGTVVWDFSSALSGVCLGGCHPLWRVVSDHFSFASEEEAEPFTLHLPRFSAWDSVWTVPVSLAATMGIPFWFLFLPLLRCFRSGGSRSVKEHPTPKSRMRSLIQESPVLRLHAPTRGVSPLAAPFFSSQAEPFSRRRGMLGRGGVHWRLVKTLRYVCVRRCLLVRGVILNRAFSAVQFTLHSAFQ
jgi:hypothetical protein